MPKHICERCDRPHETPRGGRRIKGLWCPPCVDHIKHSEAENHGAPDECGRCVASGLYEHYRARPKCKNCGMAAPRHRADCGWRTPQTPLEADHE